MIPNVLAALCSALHPFAGRVDPAPDKNRSILMRNFDEFLSKLSLNLHNEELFKSFFFSFFTKLPKSFLS